MLLRSRAPQFSLVKTGTGFCDSIPYLDEWSPELKLGAPFFDFQSAKQGLCFLIRDELELLAERYAEQSKGVQKKHSQATDSTRQHTLKKMAKMYDYYEVAKASTNYEELDFKFFLLSSDMASVISLHFEILDHFVYSELNAHRRHIYLLRKADGSHFAIERRNAQALLLSAEQLQKIQVHYRSRSAVLEHFVEQLKP